MKRLSEETLRKYVDFCDSGRPWYFALGVFVTLLIVQTALWFAADEDEKPSQWATLPAWFGIFQSIGCIRKDLAREAGGTVEAGMSAFRLFIGCRHSFLQGLCDRTEKNAARIPVFIGKGDLVKWLPGIDLTDERIKG